MRATGPPLAVLASGQGSNFVALATASREGRLGAHVALLASDREDAPVLARAGEFGIPARVIAPGPRRTRLSAEAEAEFVRVLREAGVRVILLAGFMRVLHESFLTAFSGSILNVHPSLLPAFPGLGAPGQALRHGARVTGCTVHLVDGEVDGGAILAQAAVPVRSDDDEASLLARIHAAEHALYPETVRRFLTVPFRLDGRRVLWEDGA